MKQVVMKHFCIIIQDVYCSKEDELEDKTVIHINVTPPPTEDRQWIAEDMNENIEAGMEKAFIIK